MKKIVQFILFYLDIPIKLNENLIPVKMIDNSTISIPLIHPQSGRIKRRHYAILILIFLISILSLCTVYILFPKIDPYVSTAKSLNVLIKIKFFSAERDAFKIPKTIDDAKILGNVLYKYSKHHRYIIMIAFFLTYIL
jgi:hypothetical protein